MILIDRVLVQNDQSIVVLDNGRPCPHCKAKKAVPVSDHLVSWTIPHALVVYFGDVVGAICLDCLDEKRRNAH